MTMKHIQPKMKRIALFITLLLAYSAIPAIAQKHGADSFEIGAGINAYGILGAVGGPSRTLGPGVHFEYRHAVSERFDIGGRIYYKYGTGESAPTGAQPTWGIVYNQAGAKAVADYIMRPGKAVRPYIGLGAGAGMQMETVNGSTDTSMYGTVGPRIGVQIWRFRLALESDFAYNMEYGFLSTESAMALCLGFIF